MGGGTSVFISPKTYNDDQWHSIEAKKEGKTALLRVDGEEIPQNCRIGVCDGSGTELQVRVQMIKLRFFFQSIFFNEINMVLFYSIL